MSGRRGQRVEAQPKPVRLSEWAKQAGRPVTRGECVNVIAIVVERRLSIERIIAFENRWYMRILLWLFPALSRLPKPVQHQAAEAALDPRAAGEVELGEGDVEDEEEDYGASEKEPPPEVTESGVAVRDRRSGR